MIGDILQPTHLIFILVVALLVLGPKRLPEVGRSLGRGIRDFKSAISGEDEDPSPQVTAETAPTASAPLEPARSEPFEPAPSVPLQSVPSEPFEHVS